MQTSMEACQDLYLNFNHALFFTYAGRAKDNHSCQVGLGLGVRVMSTLNCPIAF